ncbi:MAG: type II secretion system GspH family protein [Synergistaceae bacterium]|nr:type II secretion system GspH family protein [Synergistaceae bacterium]
MASRGDREIKRRLRRAFTLVEIIVVCALLAIFGGGAVSLGSSVYERLSDASDYNVRREAAEAAAWIRNCIHDSRALREDFTLKASGYSGPFSTLIAIRETPGGYEHEFWVGRNIAFSVEKYEGSPAAYHTYDPVFQTMSPGVTFNLHKRRGDGYVLSGHTITISVHGAVSQRHD